MEKKSIYITITGVNHYFGKEVFYPGLEVRLVKEPDSEFDKEAIRAELDGLGLVGYVANSTCTVLGESFSAGRVYDKFEGEATAKVMYVTNRGIICKICE